MLSFLNFSLIEWLGLIFGLSYIILAYKNRKLCWLFFMASCLCISIEDFTGIHLFFDGILQIFYIFIGGFSYFFGKEDSSPGDSLRISSLDMTRNLSYFLLAVVISAISGYLLKWNIEMAYTFLDSMKSLIALLATFLLIYKIIDAWYYLILVNGICIYLYGTTGAGLFSILFSVYLIGSLYGLKTWKAKYATQKAKRPKV